MLSNGQTISEIVTENLEESHDYNVYVKYLKGSSGSDTTVYDNEKQCNSIEDDGVTML